jgi:hypothetical protein
MAKATKRLSRKTSIRKSTKPLLRLSPLGRELLAAVIDYQSHAWLDPESGHLSEELSDDEHYRRVWKRISDRQWGEINRLMNAVMAAPLSLSNLADRVLIDHQFGDSGPIERYLPGAKRSRNDGSFEDHMPTIAAVVALSDVPREMPEDVYSRTGKGPEDAEARILAMLGKHRPKRKALTSAEEKTIASAAVAQAAAAVTAAPGDAPFFA